jgi:MFS family permease
VTVQHFAFQPRVIETCIPARLDALPWSRFHRLVIAALGITWILDGLEVTLAGALAGAFKDSPVLQFSSTEVGLVSSAYLAGAVVGALLFGWLTDRWGRKKLFFITLAVYIAATAATAASWNLWSFALFRFLTGAGIGGEYSAINSTIQELVPARFRGWTDLAINGSFWVGAAMGAGGSVVLLNPALFGPDIGWRLAFLIGALLGSVVFVMRFWIPESPRWLVTHGRERAAEAIVGRIEDGLRRVGFVIEDRRAAPAKLRTRSHTPLRQVFTAVLVTFRQRATVGLVLMSAQAFFYNAIFFTYALVLTNFYGIANDQVGWYILPFALGNFLGPLLLGRLFDSIGRVPMITATYILSGVLLLISGIFFVKDILSPATLTLCWMTVFFFASAAASSAYLTVSETFPVEIRALTIALFYAVGTAIGGVLSPALFGILIDSNSRTTVFQGYLLGAMLMIIAGAVQWRYGIAAERKELEAVARPLAYMD